MKVVGLTLFMALRGKVIEGHHFTLLTDTVHLFKSVRNNWETEKSQKISIVYKGKTITGDWSDVIKVYEKEKLNIVRRTPLTYSTCYPNNMEKQKVSLMLNVFNERTIAALKEDGHNGTAEFVSLFTKMWHIVNTKTTNAHIRLSINFTRIGSSNKGPLTKQSPLCFDGYFSNRPSRRRIWNL